MHEFLKRNLFLIKEHVGMFKAANNYDIYDPQKLILAAVMCIDMVLKE